MFVCVGSPRQPCRKATPCLPQGKGAPWRHHQLLRQMFCFQEAPPSQQKKREREKEGLQCSRSAIILLACTPRANCSSHRLLWAYKPATILGNSSLQGRCTEFCADFRYRLILSTRLSHEKLAFSINLIRMENFFMTKLSWQLSDVWRAREFKRNEKLEAAGEKWKGTTYSRTLM